MSDQDRPTPPQDENQLIAERREKLKALREAHKAGGSVAFPNDFKPGHRAAALQPRLSPSLRYNSGHAVTCVPRSTHSRS